MLPERGRRPGWGRLSSCWQLLQPDWRLPRVAASYADITDGIFSKLLLFLLRDASCNIYQDINFMNWRTLWHGAINCIGKFGHIFLHKTNMLCSLPIVGILIDIDRDADEDQIIRIFCLCPIKPATRLSTIMISWFAPKLPRAPASSALSSQLSILQHNGTRTSTVIICFLECCC